VYEIGEPTLSLWNKLSVLKDLQDEDNYSVTLISLATGLTDEEIRKADWFSIYTASQTLTEYLLNQSDKFYNEFEFRGQKYGFIDLKKLTFGEFIDIDEFLRQPLSKRQSQLHFLMALFYREIEDDKLTQYDASKIDARAELFRELPAKYLNGALRFFLTLENILRASTPSFSLKTKIKIWWMRQHLMVSMLFGAGIQPFILWLKKTYSKWIKSFKSRLPWRSTS
jgi:hypothetical protein